MELNWEEESLEEENSQSDIEQEFQSLSSEPLHKIEDGVELSFDIKNYYNQLKLSKEFSNSSNNEVLPILKNINFDLTRPLLIDIPSILIYTIENTKIEEEISENLFISKFLELKFLFKERLKIFSVSKVLLNECEKIIPNFKTIFAILLEVFGAKIEVFDDHEKIDFINFCEKQNISFIIVSTLNEIIHGEKGKKTNDIIFSNIKNNIKNLKFADLSACKALYNSIITFVYFQNNEKEIKSIIKEDKNLSTFNINEFLEIKNIKEKIENFENRNKNYLKHKKEILLILTLLLSQKRL